MSILDLHADDFQAAAVTMPRIAPPPAPPRWSAWSAPGRGLAAGAAESTGFWADVVGAFGQVGGAYPEALGVNPNEQQRKEADIARQKLLTEGVSYSSEAGDLFRDVGRSYEPDPQTASTAEQLLLQFARFGGKAVGYGLAGGPVVGSALFGADEGLTAADSLRQQGVDEATRTKVGAVAGLSAAAALALPIAGKTVAQTFGLVLAGGPVAFSAQQAASRSILASAGYDDIAQTFDPFDPVGLAVATLVPAGFGAMALRGARIRGSDATAKAEASPELVDAARVSLDTEVRQGDALAAPADFRAGAADDAARSRAADQIAAGERVNVTDVAPMGSPRALAAAEHLRARIDEALRSPALVRAGVRGDGLLTDRYIAEVNGASGFDAQADIEARAAGAAVGEVPGVGPQARPEPAGTPAPLPAPEAVPTFRQEAPAVSKPAANQVEQAARRTEARVIQIQAERPDLMVRMDGMDAPVRLSEFLATVKAEADEMAADAPLFELVAQCALVNGS